jgi:4-hydroxy-3-methylbut-2-enyl diphosphate reductase IspH
MEVDIAQLRGSCAGVVGALVPQTPLRLDHTTAIIAALKRGLNDFQRPDIRDICYATQNRQSAVRDLSKFADAIPGVDAARGLTAISCATPAPTPGLQATR